MNDDVRRLIYGTIIGFLAIVLSWLGLIFVSACGFSLSCVQAAPIVIRTSVPTLIPIKQSQPQPQATAAEFNKCKVGATDLIAAWAMAGHQETEPFPFTDLNGQACEGTFADIQPLFVNNSVWFPGALGCTSCHNAELSDRSAGLDLSSYQGVTMGSRRVPEATSPGTDIFGRGVWEKSILYDVLFNQGLTLEGHSPDVPPNQVILYAGHRVAESQMTATPAATSTP